MCSLFVVCCLLLLFALCRLVAVRRQMFFVACCLVFVADCSLVVGCWLLAVDCFVGKCLLRVGCWSLVADCCSLLVVFCWLPVDRC